MQTKVEKADQEKSRLTLEKLDTDEVKKKAQNATSKIIDAQKQLAEESDNKRKEIEVWSYCNIPEEGVFVAQTSLLTLNKRMLRPLSLFMTSFFKLIPVYQCWWCIYFSYIDPQMIVYSHILSILSEKDGNPKD